MSKLITDEVAAQVKERLAALEAPVRLIFFSQPQACGGCADQHELLQALSGLSGKLSLEVYPLDSAQADEYGVDKVPATVVRGADDPGIRFFGLTGGYEFGSLLEAILLVSRGPGELEPGVAELAKAFTVPTHIEVLVTLGCPYCPKMVRLAHELAAANEHVRADMIDASEFPQLIERYEVSGVPLTVVNGRRGFEGALPPEQAALEILKVADRDAYETVEMHLREARGERRAHDASPEEHYDVIVVGAGPAGLSAALYAERKGLKTALIGKQAGGQINDTATIENYLGLARVGGAELAEAMRDHLERYPVSERCRTAVTSIERDGEGFAVRTDDDRVYRARSLIYCAGKRYRRLDVPGEERFMGRGIAWCATCDAPLYKDKRVAVVGGGNSALTAVRDLLHYAAEIYLVHMLGEFQADSVLVEETRAAERAGKVHVYLNSRIREYLGRDRLEGIRVAAMDGDARFDLPVDGVFLEVGLEPNSAPLRGLVELNELGEVPVDRYQQTAVPGLFAAGDVTDEPDKQIVIAAGAGAKAALAVDRWLATRALR
jgi:alkyl hydroperoxide reductase subunit F